MKSLFTKSTILSIGMIAFLFVTLAPINAADTTEATSSEEKTTTTEEVTPATEEAADEQAKTEVTSTDTTASSEEVALSITVPQFEALQKVMLDQAEAQNKFQKAVQAWEDNFVNSLDAQVGEATETNEAKK
jgi:sortase (surface protein transpeptidase)